MAPALVAVRGRSRSGRHHALFAQEGERLTRGAFSTIRDPRQAVFQLAHEVIHLLAPLGRRGELADNNGEAAYFSFLSSGLGWTCCCCCMTG